MSMYLVAAFVLLVAMLFLVLRPFLLASVEPVAADGAVPVPVAVAQRVTPAPRPQPVTAETVTTSATAPTGGTDVRATVEAAIAARKAALRGRHCPGCDGRIEDGDVFCRSCGAKVSA